MIGTFGPPRVGNASLITGIVATQLHASVLSHFPGASFSTSPTLTPGYLAGVDILMITPASTTTTPISLLTASEQSALFNYVQQGGNALLIMEPFFLFEPAANSIVSPFGMTIVDDGLTGVQTLTPVNHTHPVINGPFGDVNAAAVFGAGALSVLGPYATNLAGFTVTGAPGLAVIERNAIAPGSGRVIVITDGDAYIDSTAGGLFQFNETLFLNSVSYLLVPEPESLTLAAICGVAITMVPLARARQRRKLVDRRRADHA